MSVNVPELLLAALVLGLAGGSAWQWRCLRQCRRALRALAERVERVEAEQAIASGMLGDLSAGAIGHGDRLGHLQQDLHRVRLRLEEVAALDEGGRSFGHAIRRARHGASIEELTSECGLSRAEAELVVRLHRDGVPPSDAPDFGSD